MHLNNILILPDEIIANILKYTDYKTVIALRRACRRFNEVVEASSALRYIIELAASGMCDGPPNDIVPAEQLRRLLGMQTAWKTSAWTLVDDFPYSREMSPYHIIASGNLFVFWGSRSRMSELVLLRLPSKSRGIPERIWFLDLDCNNLEAFCADDSQDLLVFPCSTTIHVRTLSTGSVHPLTTNGGTIHPRSTPGSFGLCIHGDLILILLGVRSSIWDWKTGEKIATIPLTTSCFSFLDRNHLISMHCNFSLPRTIAFQVTTLPDVAGKAPSHTYRFLLPPSIAAPSCSIALYANTLPTSWSSQRSSSAHDPAGCFHADPDQRLLVFVLGSSDREVHMTSFMLHVPHAAFLSHIAAHRACAPDDSAATAAAAAPVVVVPWCAWGPGRTHLRAVPGVFQWGFGQYRACGMLALGEPHLLDRRILRVTDYHPHRVAREAAATVPVGSGDDDPEAEGGGGEEEGNDHDTARGEPPRGSGSGGVQIPHVEKDVPLPDGLQSGDVRCILGEDVVVLLEFAAGGPANPAHRIEKIYYHPI